MKMLSGAKALWNTRKKALIGSGILIWFASAVAWSMLKGMSLKRAMVCTVLTGVGFLVVTAVLVVMAVPGLVIHEMGHAQVARWFGFKASFIWTKYGPAIKYEAPDPGPELWKQVLITAAGPAAGGLFAGVLWLCGVPALTVGDIEVGRILVEVTFWCTCAGQLVCPHPKADGWRMVRNLCIMWRTRRRQGGTTTA